MPLDPTRRSPAKPSSPGRRLPPGAPLLGLSLLVVSSSLFLAAPTAHAIYCDRLAPLAVLAALAATLIALCFRALATASNRSLLFATLLLSAIALFASARFLVRYHAACSQVEQRLQQLKRAR